VGDYRIPEIPEIEQAYRAAHRALEAIMPESFGFLPEADLECGDVLSQFPLLVDEAALVVAAHLGPYIAWQAEPHRGDLDLVPAGLDLDNGGELDFGPALDELATAADYGDSSLEQAARVYCADAGRDVAPELAGIWLLMLAPVAGVASDSRPWDCAGHLAGFMIVYDRDEDGTYETIGHIWTARAWRRRGIARQLLYQARSRFGASRFEGPFSGDGTAFAKATGEPDA
jgi:ribosomal protein S18 acetylase RimI-like enzyme